MPKIDFFSLKWQETWLLTQSSWKLNQVAQSAPYWFLTNFRCSGGINLSNKVGFNQAPLHLIGMQPWSNFVGCWAKLNVHCTFRNGMTSDQQFLTKPTQESQIGNEGRAVICMCRSCDAHTTFSRHVVERFLKAETFLNNSILYVFHLISSWKLDQVKQKPDLLHRMQHVRQASAWLIVSLKLSQQVNYLMQFPRSINTKNDWGLCNATPGSCKENLTAEFHLGLSPFWGSL